MWRRSNWISPISSVIWINERERYAQEHTTNQPADFVPSTSGWTTKRVNSFLRQQKLRQLNGGNDDTVVSINQLETSADVEFRPLKSNCQWQMALGRKKNQEADTRPMGHKSTNYKQRRPMGVVIDFPLGSRRSSLCNLAPSSAATNHRRRPEDHDRNTHTRMNGFICWLISISLDFFFFFFKSAITYRRIN